jgi:capsular polysaccharide export protein
MKLKRLTLDSLKKSWTDPKFEGGPRVCVPNRTLLWNPRLAEAGLGLLPLKHQATADAFLGWGHKKSGRLALALAKKYDKEIILAEEGFMVSGQNGVDNLQILIDTTGGVHYDPKRPSCIDAALVLADSEKVRKRARDIIQKIQDSGISKTNNRKESKNVPNSPFVMICDQVEGDASLPPSGGSKKRFQILLQSTLATWPDHTVIIRTHPKGNTGHYKNIEKNDRVIVHAGTDNPALWLKKADHVIVMSSQMGFEALIHGTPVTCWGTPFYAGRGLTRDLGKEPGYIRRKTDLELLVGAALIVAPTSYDPLTGKLTSAERVVSYLGAYRRSLEEDPEHVRTIGFSKRKIAHLQRFLPNTTLNTNPNAPVMAWGLTRDNDRDILWRAEDGFMRSNGLGAAFAPPISWLFDNEGGIHFNPTQPSQIETTLNTYPLTKQVIAYGKHIRHRLKENTITKYNLQGTQNRLYQTDLPKILVLGQVENDASLHYAPLKTNTELLKKVRQNNPNSYIIYRPHPDVVHKLRPGNIEEDTKWCDCVDTQTRLTELFKIVKSVHVITSQGGLEALIYGLPVTCYGTPFYAGWGLTTDLGVIPTRRQRTLPLDALIAVAYGIAPRYCDPKTHVICDFDMALDALLTIQHTQPTPPKIIVNKLTRILNFVKNKKGTSV